MLASPVLQSAQYSLYLLLRVVFLIWCRENPFALPFLPRIILNGRGLLPRSRAFCTLSGPRSHFRHGATKTIGVLTPTSGILRPFRQIVRELLRVLQLSRQFSPRHLLDFDLFRPRASLRSDRMLWASCLRPSIVAIGLFSIFLLARLVTRPLV